MDSQSLWHKVDLANCHKFMFTILLMKLVVLTSILFQIFVYIFVFSKEVKTGTYYFKRGRYE